MKKESRIVSRVIEDKYSFIENPISPLGCDLKVISVVSDETGALMSVDFMSLNDVVSVALNNLPGFVKSMKFFLGDLVAIVPTKVEPYCKTLAYLIPSVLFYGNDEPFSFDVCINDQGMVGETAIIRHNNSQMTFEIKYIKELIAIVEELVSLVQQ